MKINWFYKRFMKDTQASTPTGPPPKKTNRIGITELQYLERLIKYRLNAYFPSDDDGEWPELPDWNDWDLPLAKFISDNELSHPEAALLLLGLAPHIQPEIFDRAIESKIPGSSNFSRLGGVRGKNSRSFLPTGETALFLLAAENTEQRLKVQKLFGVDHLFGEKKILWLEEVPYGEPVMSGRIIISQDYIDTFIYGKPSPPHFISSFPATSIK